MCCPSGTRGFLQFVQRPLLPYKLPNFHIETTTVCCEYIMQHPVHLCRSFSQIYRLCVFIEHLK